MKAMTESGVYLIAQADEGMSTEQIELAIKQLEDIKHTRENMPL